MKYIINNKIYDTDKSTLICEYQEETKYIFEVGAKHQIYITPKNQMIHVIKCPGKETTTNILEIKEGKKILDEHCSGIILESYMQFFEIEEG